MPPRPAVLERSVEIAAPVSAAFAFHLDTRNAALDLPRRDPLVDVDGRFPVQAGDLVTLRMRRRPLPLDADLDGPDRDRGARAASWTSPSARRSPSGATSTSSARSAPGGR